MEAVKSMVFGGGGAPKDIEPVDTKNMNREDMVKMIESMQQAQKAQSQANSIKSKAMAIINSGQRQDMLKQVFDKEMEAHGHSKAAKRLQSGTWQGLGFGGGMGAATGMGVGAGVGTLVGALATVPTTGLGLLVGSGVGAIHGPFVKLGGKEQKFVEADPEKIVDAMDEERKNNPPADQQGAEGAESTEPPPRRKPKKLEIRSHSRGEPEQSDETAHKEDNGATGTADASNPRRKPKKLEVRSQPKAEPEHQDKTQSQDSVESGVADESKPKRKPRKLEVRSKQA